MLAPRAQFLGVCLFFVNRTHEGILVGGKTLMLPAPDVNTGKIPGGSKYPHGLELDDLRRAGSFGQHAGAAKPRTLDIMDNCAVRGPRPLRCCHAL